MRPFHGQSTANYHAPLPRRLIASRMSHPWGSAIRNVISAYVPQTTIFRRPERIAAIPLSKPSSGCFLGAALLLDRCKIRRHKAQNLAFSRFA